MPTYPNYSMPMNNGYSYNQQMAMQNPYTDRMSFLQGYQQSLQQPVQSISQITQQSQQMNILGKIVDSIEVVKAMDIPVDGNMYFFPKADGTEIFGKQWIVTEGRTRILNFKPVSDDGSSNSTQTGEKLKFDLSDASTTAFMERFDSLEQKISELATNSVPKSVSKSVPKSKREGAENE